MNQHTLSLCHRMDESENDDFPTLIISPSPIRFITAFRKAKDLLQSGYCGDILLCECSIHMSSLIGDKYDWHCDVNMGGGVLQAYG